MNKKIPPKKPTSKISKIIKKIKDHPLIVILGILSIIFSFLLTTSNFLDKVFNIVLHKEIGDYKNEIYSILINDSSMINDSINYSLKYNSHNEFERDVYIGKKTRNYSELIPFILGKNLQSKVQIDLDTIDDLKPIVIVADASIRKKVMMKAIKDELSIKNKPVIYLTPREHDLENKINLRKLCVEYVIKKCSDSDIPKFTEQDYERLIFNSNELWLLIDAVDDSFKMEVVQDAVNQLTRIYKDFESQVIVSFGPQAYVFYLSQTDTDESKTLSGNFTLIFSRGLSEKGFEQLLKSKNNAKLYAFSNFVNDVIDCTSDSLKRNALKRIKSMYKLWNDVQMLKDNYNFQNSDPCDSNSVKDLFKYLREWRFKNFPYAQVGTQCNSFGITRLKPIWEDILVELRSKNYSDTITEDSLYHIIDNICVKREINPNEYCNRDAVYYACLKCLFATGILEIVSNDLYEINRAWLY